MEIKHRVTGDILFSGEFNDLKSCVEAAIKVRTNLRYADLRNADLRDAN